MQYTNQRVSIFQLNNHGNPTGMALGMPDNNVCFPAPVDLTKNPLADTHEFKQACSICFIKTGTRLRGEESLVLRGHVGALDTCHYFYDTSHRNTNVL